MNHLQTSDCLQHFGYEDFDFNRVERGYPTVCPIAGCSTKLVDVPHRRGTRPFCPTHGIRLHSKTFVYWNGIHRQDDARLRNFRVRADLAGEIALRSVEKAESHRLGYEMSEDALSWNVFVSLAEARKLRQAVRFLTGRNVDAEPDLYLWGNLIDVQRGRRPMCFKPLGAVRERLERDIKRFKTEPDVMLVLDRRLLVCIEVKFGSGNPLAHEEPAESGQKPTDHAGLLNRYFDQATSETKRIIDRDAIGEVFHSQLFRNVVFASEMADGSDWHVVNLVSKTQWDRRKDSKGYSFVNPELYVRSYLHENYRQCFSFSTWEDLHRELVEGDPDLGALHAYLCSKSAHYRRAFDLH
jgi:hypothetical protein